MINKSLFFYILRFLMVKLFDIVALKNVCTDYVLFGKELM